MQTPSAVELLTAELDKCKAIQLSQWNEWEERIKELEASINILSGKSPEGLSAERFDDSSPDYIKGTEDGI